VSFEKREGDISCHVISLPDGWSSESRLFVSPMDTATLREIRWYVEDFWRWPVGPDYTRAASIEARLLAWGSALGEAVFSTPPLVEIYSEFTQEAAPDRSITIQTHVPEILGLPWELLACRGRHLFSKNPPIAVRRRVATAGPQREYQQIRGPLRVLVVVSRPKATGFLDPRTNTRAIIDAVEHSGVAVEIEFLYPSTASALQERLSTSEWHVLHFDGHGIWDEESGTGFLAFETSDGELDLLAAERIADIIREKGVRLAVLDACQTGSELGTEFSSVAAALSSSGVQNIVAMNYSVLQATSALFFREFYSSLVQGYTIGTSMGEARKALFDSPARVSIVRSGNEEKIRLQDWFVPSLIQSGRDSTPVNQSQDGSSSGGLRRIAQSIDGKPPSPAYGFQGRELALHELQQVFRGSDCQAARRTCIIHGFGGQGKTALAVEAAAWFLRIGLFGRALFLSFARGGDAELVVNATARNLFGAPVSLDARAEMIAEALTKVPTLLIWDNLDALLPGGPVALQPDALADLLDLGVKWSGLGETRLLVTSRVAELPHEGFTPNHVSTSFELRSLPLNEALDLSRAILSQCGIDYPQRAELVGLLEELGRNPLSITLVIPHLKTATPEQLINDFRVSLKRFSDAEGSKEYSLEASLNLSIEHLSASTRDSLKVLAFFRGGGFEKTILTVADAFGYDWSNSLNELVRVGLATMELVANENYVHVHPTLGSLVREELSEDELAGVRNAFYKAHIGFLHVQYGDDFKMPQVTRPLVDAEVSNLLTALDLAIRLASRDLSIVYGDYLAYFLNLLGRRRERDIVIRTLGGIPLDATRFGKATWLREFRRGHACVADHRYQDGEVVFRELCNHQRLASYEDALLDEITTLAQLARCELELGKKSEAERTLRKATKLADSTNVPANNRAALYADVADLEKRMENYRDARANYGKSIELAQQASLPRVVAVGQSQLARLDFLEGNLSSAAKLIVKALAFFSAAGEPSMVANSLSLSGEIALSLGDVEHAERSFRQSLEICDQLGARAESAGNYYGLGMVAAAMGRTSEAEEWWRQAASMFEELRDNERAANCYRLLHRFFNELGDLTKSERYKKAWQSRVRPKLDAGSE